MADAVIRHRMDLALRLVDTTTGNIATDRVTRITLDGRIVHPIPKDNALVFIGIGRESAALTVEAQGFEEKRLTVDWGTLDENLPLLELHLIPSLYYQATSPCHTLTGRLAGITELCAVKAGDAPCLLRGFDRRKGIITVFNPHALEMDGVFYAVVDPEGETFEPFRIKKRLSDTDYLIDPPLQKPFSNHFPVTRLVFGAVTGEGDYLLRVRDDGNPRWLARYMEEETERFQPIDFSAESAPKLGAGGLSGARAPTDGTG